MDKMIYYYTLSINMVKQRINILIDEETLKKLDIKRGLIPRSAYVDHLIKQDLRK
jgi:hypothetical protein